jgi:hypothetical protein
MRKSTAELRSTISLTQGILVLIFVFETFCCVSIYPFKHSEPSHVVFQSFAKVCRGPSKRPVGAPQNVKLFGVPPSGGFSGRLKPVLLTLFLRTPRTLHWPQSYEG